MFREGLVADSRCWGRQRGICRARLKFLTPERGFRSTLWSVVQLRVLGLPPIL